MFCLIFSRFGPEIESRHRPFPRRRDEEAAQHPDGGRFPRPVGAEEAEDLPLADREAHVPDGDEVAEPFREPPDGNRGLFRRRASFRGPSPGGEDGNEDVLQPRLDGADPADRDPGVGQRLPHGVRPQGGVARPRVDPVAEQPDGRSRETRPSGRPCPRLGSAHRTSRIVPAWSRFTSSGVPTARSRPSWSSARRRKRSASSR